MYQIHNLGEQNGTKETAIAYDFCNYSFLVDEISISFLFPNFRTELLRLAILSKYTCDLIFCVLRN